MRSTKKRGLPDISNHRPETKLKERNEELLRVIQVLEEEKARSESILSAIGDGFVVTDDEGKIRFLNKKFEEVLGWEAYEVFSKDLLKIVPAEDESGNPIKPTGKISHFDVSGGKTTSVSGLYFIKKDGSKVPVFVTAAPIIFKGKIMGAVEVFRDITKEKEIDRAKTEFVSLASHQLRTPLSTIKWHIELFLDGDLGELTSEQKNYLRETYDANEKMIDFVNTLLNLSRIEMGAVAIKPQEINLEELTKSVLAELIPQVLEKNLEISRDFGKGAEVIKADRQMLGVVLQNLISNSVKYTPAGGKIKISSERRGNSALISVSDNGYGIPKEQQSQIFAKLFRADNARKLVSDGTGLGLYIVKYALERIGGKIRFESEENKGTSFYVELPLEEKGQQ